jgi:hypothetical protein
MSPPEAIGRPPDALRDGSSRLRPGTHDGADPPFALADDLGFLTQTPRLV